MSERKRALTIKQFLPAFTLIELMVVISIIGILSAMGLYSYNNTQGKARDAVRKSTLKDLQKAVQQYYQDNGSYPSTNGNWCASESGDPVYGNCASGVYIPGLAPTYIATLPKDTKGGLSTMTNCTAGGFYRSFWYKSDGLNYKVSSHCAAEGTINAQDPLVDPCNTTVSWAIYNIGATCAAGY